MGEKKNPENLGLTALQVKSATQKMACAHSVFADSAQEKADLFYVESN